MNKFLHKIKLDWEGDLSAARLGPRVPHVKIPLVETSVELERDFLSRYHAILQSTYFLKCLLFDGANEIVPADEAIKSGLWTLQREMFGEVEELLHKLKQEVVMIEDCQGQMRLIKIIDEIHSAISVGVIC